MGSIITINDPVIARKVCSLAATDPTDETTHRILDFATDVDEATALRTHDADLLAQATTSRRPTLLSSQTFNVTDAQSWCANWIDVRDWQSISWSLLNTGPKSPAYLWWKWADDAQGSEESAACNATFTAVIGILYRYDTLPPATAASQSTARQPIMAGYLKLGAHCATNETATLTVKVYGTLRR